MSGVLRNPDGVVVGTCEHCGVVVERDLEQAGLTVAENQEIAEAVAKNHAHRCPAGEGWHETVAVDVSVKSAGTTAEPRGVESE